MATPETLRTEILNNLNASTFANVQAFAQSVGNKCWREVADLFYSQPFSQAEKDDIINRLIALNHPLIYKTLALFLKSQDSSYLSQILPQVDPGTKRFILKYAADDNLRVQVLNSNPDRDTLLVCIAGMRDKSKVSSYASSSDHVLRNAYYMRVDTQGLIDRLWR